MKKLLIAMMLVGISTNSFSQEKNKDDKKIERVIALNVTTVEILKALGVESKIVGIDASALTVEGMKDKTSLGHPYRPSVEGIISLAPDIVLATDESIPEQSRVQLIGAKVNLVMLGSSYLDGVKGLENRISIIAKIFNKEAEGKKLIADLDKKMSALNDFTKKIKEKKSVFFLYTHGPGSAQIYGKNTGTHLLIEAAGAQNAADFTTGTKPLTTEAMVKSSPDSIIMLTRGLKAVGGIDGALKLPGVNLTAAGKSRKILEVNDSIRWVGLQFPDFALKLYKEIYE